MDIIYLLRVLWRKKWIIILIPLISVIAAFVFTQNLKTAYKATTQIATGFTTNEGVSITDEKFNLRGVDVKFSNLLASMKSGTIINMVTYRMALNKIDSIDQKKVNDLEKFNSEEISKAKAILIEKLAEQKTISVNDPHSDLLRDILQATDLTFGRFNDGFNISRVPNTDYIQISFTSTNPQLSAKAVNVYCEEFLRYYISTKRESSSESVTFIKELVERKKEELDAKTEALQAFKANNNLVGTEPQGEVKNTQIYNLEEQRDQINNTLYGLRLKIENLRNSLAEKSGGQIGKSSNQRIIDLKKKIDIMNDRFISSGTNDANLLDSLNLLRQQYRMELSMMERGGNALQATGMTSGELEAAIKEAQIEVQVEESRLNRVNQKLASLRGNLSGYARNEAILNTLERDVKVASDEYLSAVNKYNEAENKLLASSGTIRQVYKASPPASPESSKRILIIALAGIATFGITLFGIIVIEVIDGSIKTSEQYQKLVGLPLAGTLINVGAKKLNFPALFSKKNPDKDLELFKHFLRKIRFELEKSDAKTFLITSPKEGEGKTFITFSLAYVLSLVKKRILIIDTNFKNNSLTKWLVVPKKNMKYLDQKTRSSGELKIFDKMDGEQEINEKRKHQTDFVVATKYRNISIIGNSGSYESPEEIFYNKDFHSLIEGLALQFDYILLEGPSLNEFSDSKELIKYVDKVIPVFSAESSIKQMDKDSIEFLESLNGKLSGAILNKIDPQNLNV